MKLRTHGVALLLLTLLAVCTQPPPLKADAVPAHVSALTDTTVRYGLDCGSTAFRAANPDITDCRWTIHQGGQTVAAAPSLLAILSFTSHPGDSVQVVASAETHRNGSALYGPPTSVTFWMRVPDAVPQRADTIPVRVCPPGGGGLNC